MVQDRQEGFPTAQRSSSASNKRARERAPPQLCGRLELFESRGQAISVWVINIARWQDELLSVELPDRFESRAITKVEQPRRNVNSKIGIDTDQMRIEGRVVNFRQRDAVADHWLAKLLICIARNMRRVEKQAFRQS